MKIVLYLGMQKFSGYIILLFLLINSCMHHRVNTYSPVVFDMQGHRGCRSVMPENTIPGMLKAINLGVTTLEMDVVITKNKLALLSHEPFFNHEITTKPDGKFVLENEERLLNIYNMTYEETKKYDVGLKPHPRFPGQQKMKVSKPLLGELIDSVELYCKNRSSKPNYNIETKIHPLTDNIYHPSPQVFVDIIMSVILDKKIDNRVNHSIF